jgi:hypothetical protein
MASGVYEKGCGVYGRVSASLTEIVVACESGIACPWSAWSANASAYAWKLSAYVLRPTGGRGTSIFFWI